MSTIEELLGIKSSACGLESREYSRWEELALTSPTSSGHLVSIVRLLTQAKEFSCSVLSDCARTRFLLEREGVTELPTCCANGNFRKKQCRRGLCYCVDCNGNQEGKESKSVQCDGDDDSCSICVKSRQEMKKERSSTISWETLSEEIFQ
jgi:hypothetical protein